MIIENFVVYANIEIISLVVFIFTLLFSNYLFPKLIDIVRFQNVIDKPTKRSSHSQNIPTLGGIVLYVCFIFGFLIIHYFDFEDSSFSIIIAITILFMIGLKDDMLVLSPKTKLIAELIASTFIIILPGMIILNFEGFLGITEIPWSISFILSYVILIFIINTYNLIDGIDGLAGFIGIFIISVYSYFNYINNNYFYLLLGILTLGFLVAFLTFNLSKDRKIFLGDTGSLIIGLIIGFLTLNILSLDSFELQNLGFRPQNKFLIIASILFFPAIDVGRVIIMRLLNDRSPFSPDRSHMHHILIDKGLTHFKASLILVITAITVFLFIYSINTYVTVALLSIIFLFITLFTYSVLLVLDSNSEAVKIRRNIKSWIPRKIQIMEFKFRKRIIILLKSTFFKDLH